jgi:hypothetical protein
MNTTREREHGTMVNGKGIGDVDDAEGNYCYGEYLSKT